jgi:hypothetical protein
VPSIGQGPSPRDALSSARLGPGSAPRLGRRGAVRRRLFTRAGPLRDPRGPGPRPRAPLPAGVTLLWASTSLADFCNLIRRAGTPDERSILAHEWGFRPAARRHQPMPVASASAVRRRTAGLRAASCSRRLARAVLHLRGRGRSRAEASERRRRGALSKERRTGPPRSASGTRVTGASRHEVWRPRAFVAPAETHLGCRPAKGGTVGRIEVPSAAMEPLRERGIAPSRAPGPRPRHAASEEALLESSRAFRTAFAAPASDEESTLKRLDPPNQRSGSPRGTAGRSTHHGFYDRISSRADVPRTS